MIYYVDNLADTIKFYHSLLKNNGIVAASKKLCLLLRLLDKIINDHESLLTVIQFEMVTIISNLQYFFWH